MLNCAGPAIATCPMVLAGPPPFRGTQQVCLNPVLPSGDEGAPDDRANCAIQSMVEHEKTATHEPLADELEPVVRPSPCASPTDYWRRERVEKATPPGKLSYTQGPKRQQGTRQVVGSNPLNRSKTILSQQMGSRLSPLLRPRVCSFGQAPQGLDFSVQS